MKKHCYWLFFLLFTSVFSQPIHANDHHLIFAIDIIRHGARTPEAVIPSSPYPWKEGLGELTSLGMAQSFHLGCTLRKKYIEKEHFLPSSYQAASIYVRSTDYRRTLMTAQSLLYGLYPLGTGPALFFDNRTPALPQAFQPVPIHTISQQDDCLLIPACSSKAFFALVEKHVYSSQEWKDKTAEYKDKFKEWSTKTGLTLQRLNDIVRLANDLDARETYGIPLPLGIDENESKEIQSLAHWVASSIYKPLAVGQYGSRDLLSAIAHYLENSAREKTELKYVLFSAHDSTLMSLMSAFQNPVTTIPAYSSDIKILLFRTKQPDSYIVHITYNDLEVKIPACKKEDCTLNEFISFVEESKK